MKVTVDEDRFRGHVMRLTRAQRRSSVTEDGCALADSSDVSAGFGGAVEYVLTGCPGQANVEIAY